MAKKPIAQNGKKKPESLAGISIAAAQEEAVIYCRVSSDRQAKEGDGARSQESRCRSYVQSLGYRLLGTFSDDGVSGAVVERPGMEALLDTLRARRRHGGTTVVVIDDISRIARDVSAHFTLRSAIKLAGGRLESPSFTFGDTAADELVETIMAATAQFGRTGNREQVLNRMRARLEAGYWTFPPPPGYTFVRHPLHKKILSVSPADKEALASALNGFASGRYQTQRQVGIALYEAGFFGKRDGRYKCERTWLTVVEKRVSRMFKMLPLYAGLIEYPGWQIERRPAQHEAVITLGTLARIEERLGLARNRHIPLGEKGVARSNAQPELPLRNFVRCQSCARPLTGSLAKGLHPRYNCYHQACSRYGHSFSAREKVDKSFVLFLQQITPSDTFIDLIETLTPATWEILQKEDGTRESQLEKELARTQEQIGGLVRRLGGVPDEIASELIQEISGLKQQTLGFAARIAEQHAEKTYKDYQAAWERVNTYFCNPAGTWKNGSENEKRTVHRMVFTVPPKFDPILGLNTYELSLPYQISDSFKGLNSQVVDLTGESSHQNLSAEADWQGWFGSVFQWSEWLNS